MNSLFTTSAAAQPEDSSVLATLRQLAPHRQLSIDEAKRIAEWQAHKLRLLFEIDSPTFPHEIICDLPRLQVEFDTDLPVSGSAHWNGNSWVIMLNALEGHARQRFSLCHEFKHVLDHSVKNFLYHDDGKQAEQVADYFAGCLLMPRQHIKSLYYQGIQKPSELSQIFLVSPRAIQFRLQQLGIVDDPSRCGRWDVQPKYYRQKQLAGSLA